MANRVVSVGSLDRARILAGLLGGQVVTHKSSRGFTIFTGELLGVPISVVATGMVRPMIVSLSRTRATRMRRDDALSCAQGTANMDFVVRETRAVVDGPMAIIRFGTCGGTQRNVPPGSVVVSGMGSVSVVRDPDAFFDDAVAGSEYYRVSRVMPASQSLSKSVRNMWCLAGWLAVDPVVRADWRVRSCLRSWRAERTSFRPR